MTPAEFKETRVEIANRAAQTRIGGQKGTVPSAHRQFRSLITRLKNGKLTQEQFTERFAQTLSIGHDRAAYVGFRHGQGGLGQSKAVDQYVSATVAQEADYARELAEDILSEAKSLKQGLLAAKRYAQRMAGTANEGYRLASEIVGREIFWDTNGAVEAHCAECPEYESLSPWKADELPTVPKGGKTPCFLECKCSLRGSDGYNGFGPVSL